MEAEEGKTLAAPEGDRERHGQIKSRERVRDLAEVYTHEREVHAMLDLGEVSVTRGYRVSGAGLSQRLLPLPPFAQSGSSHVGVPPRLVSAEAPRSGTTPGPKPVLPTNMPITRLAEIAVRGGLPRGAPSRKVKEGRSVQEWECMVAPLQ